MIDDLDHLKKKVYQLNKLIEAPKADVVSDAAAFRRISKGMNEREEVMSENECKRPKARYIDTSPSAMVR